MNIYMTINILIYEYNKVFFVVILWFYLKNFFNWKKAVVGKVKTLCEK